MRTALILAVALVAAACTEEPTDPLLTTAGSNPPCMGVDTQPDFSGAYDLKWYCTGSGVDVDQPCDVSVGPEVGEPTMMITGVDPSYVVTIGGMRTDAEHVSGGLLIPASGNRRIGGVFHCAEGYAAALLVWTDDAGTSHSWMARATLR